MARNNELIKVAKRIADAWRNTDDYYQAARIIDALVSELEEMPTLTQPNEPLTLEELREMDGQPVWLEDLEDPEQSRWRVVHCVEKCLIQQSISRIEYLAEEIGKTWLAYRCPPEV